MIKRQLCHSIKRKSQRSKKEFLIWDCLPARLRLVHKEEVETPS